MQVCLITLTQKEYPVPGKTIKATFIKIVFALLVMFATLITPSLISNAKEKDGLFGIPEMPIIGLPDIAIASFYYDGRPVIYYNPLSVNRTNPMVVKFIRAHEYGHHKLGHLKQQMFANNPYAHILLAREGEIEADRFATKYWMDHDPKVISAIITQMRSPLTANWGDWTHLPSPERARLIEAYASELERNGDDSDNPDSPVNHDEPDESEVPRDKPFSFFVDKCRNGVGRFKGKEEPMLPGIGKLWNANVSFPGASHTDVDRDEGMESLTAEFKCDSSREAKETFDELVAWAKRDLGEGWKVDIKKETTKSSCLCWWRAKFSLLKERVKVDISYFERKSGTDRVNVSFTPR